MENVSVSPVVNIALNESQSEIIRRVERLTELLRRNEVQCKPFSNSALARLAQVADAGVLNNIIKTYQSVEDSLMEIPAIESDEPYDVEIKRVKMALSRFGLRVEDGFWTQLQKGDIIEIYGLDMIQMYRSINFYSKTGYSLLDLAINEWFVLWERPQSMLKELIDLNTSLIEGRTKAGKLTLSRHLIKEIHNSGATEPFEPRTLSVEFKYAAPIYKSVSERIGGFIITSRCELVSVGEDVGTIDFI